MHAEQDVPRVREADPPDAAALARLAEATFRDTYAAENTPEDLETYVAAHFGEELQARELRDPRLTTWVAVAGDELVGYLQMRREAPCPVPEVEGPTAEVARCYVRRGWHGHGVGRALIKSVISRARREGARLLWLSVWERNPGAIAFYGRCGFAIAGATTFTLGADVQHDHVMALRLLP